MTQQDNTEFIGFLGTQEMDDCLRLLAVMRETRKGPIIREILEYYLLKHNTTVESLTDGYASNLYSRWYTFHREKKNFDAYVKGVKEDLEKRQRLPRRLINEIVKKCKEQQKRNNPSPKKSSPE